MRARGVLVLAVVLALVAGVAAYRWLRPEPSPAPRPAPPLPEELEAVPAPPPSTVGEIVVDGDAAEGGDGTAAAPFRTLGDALARAEGGEDVVVREASTPYEWRVEGVELPVPVVVRPSPGERPEVDGFEFLDVSGVTVTGFELGAETLYVRNGRGWELSRNTIRGELRFQRGGGDIAIVGNRFESGDSRAIMLDRRDRGFTDDVADPIRGVRIAGNEISAAADGVQALGADDVVVEDNVFHSIRGAYHPDGIQVLEGRGWVIRRNVIRDYEWQGIILQTNRTFSERTIRDVRIENNLIYDGGGTGIIVGRGTEGIVVVNNTIWGVGRQDSGGAGLHYNGGVGLVAFNNILQSIYRDGGGGGAQHFSHNLVGEEPGFRGGDDDEAGFSLLPGSAAVDGGMPSFRGEAAPSTDLEREDRGAAPDLGALEHPRR